MRATRLPGAGGDAGGDSGELGRGGRDRDREREQQEKATRERRLAEYQAVLDAERKIREEEEAADKARREQEELRKSLAKGSVEKKLDKFQKAREAARKKKLAGDGQAALEAAKACTDLVALDCKTGNCKLLTATALHSPLCARAELEKAANASQAAGMGEVEAAKKVVLAEKPNITDDTFSLDPSVLDELISHLSTLAAIYHKPPSTFVSQGRKAAPGLGGRADDDEIGRAHV